MPFNSLIRSLIQSPLTTDLIDKLNRASTLHLQGASRLAKGLVTSAIAQKQANNILIVCATLEESARWMAQIELMGWKYFFFYPTSEASPYESFDSESEMIWGQLQTISSLLNEEVTSQPLAKRDAPCNCRVDAPFNLSIKSVVKGD